MIKWIVAGFFGVVIVIVLGMAFGMQVLNPGVMQELVEDPMGARAARVMAITRPDGETLPVNYLREGNLVFAGIDGRWWRQYLDGGAPATVLIQGETLTGHARVVLDDQDYVDDVFARLRPDAPDWLPDWLNGKLLVITLDPSQS